MTGPAPDGGTSRSASAVHVPGSTPYPWPFDGDLDPARLALVVTGWDTGWRAAVADAGAGAGAGDPGLEAAVDNIGRLVAAVPRVITVSHPLPPRPGPGAPRPGPGALTPLGAHHVHAGGIDGFWASALDHLVGRTGVDRLLLAGLGLETTVHSTLRSANDRGLECLVVIDACAPLAPDLVRRSVSMIEMSGGIFGAVATTADVLSVLSPPSSPGPPSTPGPAPTLSPPST